jgi:hypothetical protein
MNEKLELHLISRHADQRQTRIVEILGPVNPDQSDSPLIVRARNGQRSILRHNRTRLIDTYPSVCSWNIDKTRSI